MRSKLLQPDDRVLTFGDPDMKAFPPYLPALMVEDMVRAALLEDLGRAGDITTAATIAPHLEARAAMNMREAGVMVGLDLARAAFRLVDPALSFEALASDGDRLDPGAALARISGPARGLLSAERVALNFLMHLSGVATLTARYAAAIAHTRAKVCCTRKTLPGLRALEKHAVRLGGGSNHRYGLDDAILIKDNHIAVSGGVVPAIRAAQAYAGHLVRIEVEVDTLDQMREALTATPDAILLDNMAPDTLAEAVALNARHWGLSVAEYGSDIRRTRLEASGNVTLETIAAIAESGVDYISTSRITMAAPTLDIGLDIEISAST
jgi:nicotinate-nucleotide pyrophosphorylase (carboxylating)